MAMKYLIAPSMNQTFDKFGKPKGPIKAMVTQGSDKRFTPVPINVDKNWWMNNENGTLDETCPAYIKKIGGKFDGLSIGLASTPESFATQTEQNSSKESPVGSLQPVVAFSSTGARTLSFAFQIFGDYLPKLPKGTGIRNYNVVTYCKFLQQLAMPTQNENVIIPPIVEFYYGGIHMIGLFKCDTTFNSTTTNGIIDRATVSISIIETEKIINGEVYI